MAQGAFDVGVGAWLALLGWLDAFQEVTVPSNQGEWGKLGGEPAVFCESLGSSSWPFNHKTSQVGLGSGLKHA